MAVEIERKFLVKELPKLDGLDFAIVNQGYLISSGVGLLRIRTFIGSDNNKKGFITVKEKGLLSRNEYEMEIPYEVANNFLERCEKKVCKKRYFIPNGETTIELDVFAKNLIGLVIAEVEMKSEKQEINLPDWFGKEVTSNEKYANINLAYLGFPN